MRTTLLTALLLLASPTARAEDKPKADAPKAAPYVHVVIFHVKKDAPKDAVEAMIKDCHEMLAKIPTVRHLRVGRPAEKATELAKKDYQLALDLYDTGIYDAMYLAGLIADDMKMTKKDLRHWIKNAHCPALCEYTVPWVAAGSQHGLELAREWIESEKESVAMAG